MRRSTLHRVLLVTMLTAGLAVASEGVALADGPSKRPASEQAKKRKKPTIKVASTDLGSILVDGKGRTLYAYSPDGENIDESQCTGGCATAWPPLTAKQATVGKGLDASFVTVNGSKQVAYNNHLLYRFGGDAAKGDTFGQGVGGVWYVVGADGSPITT